MQETHVWFLDQEDSLEEEMATHCSLLAWEIPRAIVHGVTFYFFIDDFKAFDSVHHNKLENS